MTGIHNITVAISAIATFAIAFSANAGAMSGPKVIAELRHAQTAPLRDLIREYGRKGALGAHTIIPLHRLRVGRGTRDALGNTTLLAALNTTDELNFEGVDFICSPPGYCVSPSPSGAVGATEYVQWVNTEYEVYDKSTGAPLSGPIAGNTLWYDAFGASDPCGGNNEGNSVVLYDKAAGRWVLEQQKWDTPPFFECMAVSTSSDALGSYNVYEFSLGSTQEPLYPELGTWPASGNSGYFLTADNYAKDRKGSWTFDGAMLCGIDRASMLAGGAASMQCFQLSSTYGGVLPGDLDGTTLPPSGADENFADFTGTKAVNFWHMHADFANPNNTTLVGPTAVAVPSFTALCASGDCVPQKGTSTSLESMGERLMYRLAYRNFGDHESLVTNHSVQVNRRGAVRWYEFQNPAHPTLAQSGNVVDSSLWYWMGSIAMDKAGDMAAGFSTSSGTAYPGINYAGRSAGDPAGTMSAHAGLTTTGGGSQTEPYWGHRSSMSVDPGDDCTFFYTTEYLQLSGGFFNWSTRVNSFKFNTCN
ncbi:MAG TPA: hypothetical protein VNX86_12855 [Rhizomicrobium sp.]|nr:hypothetical protein [Rhizomicrobium sp.]